MAEYPDTRHTRTHAREIKFLLHESAACAVRDWARARLTPDPHGHGPHQDEYSPSTLYFDTDALDVFHRRGSFGRSKYRVRRYGTSDVIFFERKMRTNDLLVKRRTAAPLYDLPRLGLIGSDDTWPPNWFHQRLQIRNLTPVCHVTYHRTARTGMGAYGLIRLTLDDRLTAVATDTLAFGGGTTTPIIPGMTILELKFRVQMPAFFKELAERFALVPQPISKYRLAVSGLGLAPAGTENAVPTTPEPHRA
jgi:hypothetical protein